MDSKLLCGLDIGSTTTRMVVARAVVRQRAEQGGFGFLDYKLEGDAKVAFTPFLNSETINLSGIEKLVESWLQEKDLQPSDFWAGGILLTGLASRAENSEAIRVWAKEKFKNILAATAEDHLFESWIAYQANCASLAEQNPERYFLNFDIGGGTTNVCLGKGKDVLDCGCWNIGARHFLLERLPTDYQNRAKKWCREYVDALSTILESISKADAKSCDVEKKSRLQGFARTWSIDPKNICITFSGGVGEVLYQLANGSRVYQDFEYQDLGVLLAREILGIPSLVKNVKTTQPHSLGAATVLGLAIHATQISGSSIFLSAGLQFPLEQVSILGSLDFEMDDAKLNEQIALSTPIQRASAFTVPARELPKPKDLEIFAIKLRKAILERLKTHNYPICLITNRNFAKTLGHYLTDWGNFDLPLVIIDEVESGLGKFVRIGASTQNYLPVTFYGFKHASS